MHRSPVIGQAHRGTERRFQPRRPFSAPPTTPLTYSITQPTPREKQVSRVYRLIGARDAPAWSRMAAGASRLRLPRWTECSKVLRTSPPHTGQGPPFRPLCTPPTNLCLCLVSFRASIAEGTAQPFPGVFSRPHNSQTVVPSAGNAGRD